MLDTVVTTCLTWKNTFVSAGTKYSLSHRTEKDVSLTYGEIYFFLINIPLL